MANPERGEFDLTINGTTYTLTLKTAALMALQKHFSTPEITADLGDILQRIQARSLEHLVAGLWVAMLKYQPEMTFADTVNLLDDCDDWDQISAVFALLMSTTQPDTKDVAELQATARPRKARAKRGTGGNGTSRLAASA